jgi:hypothetical protein
MVTCVHVGLRDVEDGWFQKGTQVKGLGPARAYLVTGQV